MVCGAICCVNSVYCCVAFGSIQRKVDCDAAACCTLNEGVASLTN